MKTQKPLSLFILPNDIAFGKAKLLFLFLIGFMFLFIGVVSGVGTYPNVDSNMVLYYHFNNDSSVGENYNGTVGNIIVDYSNTKNNGSLANTTIYNSTGGFLGDGGFELDGSNGYIVSNNRTLNFSNGLTVMIWIKPNDLVGEDGDLITRYVAQNGNRSWALSILNNVTIMVGSTDGITTVIETGATSINNKSKYYFLTGVWDGTQLLVYVNGLLDGGTGTSLASIVNSEGIKIEIGRSRRTTFLNASIDEPIVLNRSFSATEVWDYYHTYNGCITPSGSNTILGGNTTLCTGSYNLNTSTSIVSGAINLNADNSILDCNRSTIYGNWSFNDDQTYQGIFTDNKNSTIKNCIVHSYGRNIRLRDGANNVLLLNNTLYNGDFLTYVSDSWYVRVLNNTYSNNSKENYGDIKNSFYGTNASHILIEGNNFTNTTQLSMKSFINGTIKDNIFQGGGSFVFLHTSFTDFIDLLIEDNLFNVSDRGVRFGDNSTNGIIRNNIILNMFTDTDGYLAGIEISGNRTNPNSIVNLTIQNNTIKDFGCVGILLRDIQSGVVKANIISQNFTWLFSSYPQTFAPECDNEPMTGIFVSQIYKGFIPTGTQTTDNYTVSSIHQSDNLTITNNTYIGIAVPLRIQGKYSNITHDLTNYWFRSFQLPYLEDREYYFILNSFSNATGNLISGSFETLLKKGINANFSVSYSLFDTYSFFKNTRSDNFAPTINIYNLSNALIYNTNGSIFGSTTISNNDGNVNITLNAGNSSYVLDNFNLTEGVTRANSPLSFSQSSDTEKHIASSLVDTINATILFNIDSCDNVDTITYTSDSGNYTQIFSKRTLFNPNGYVCQNNQVSLDINQIEPSISSNVIIINYDAYQTSAINQILNSFAVFGLVMLIVIMGVIIKNILVLKGGGEISLGTILFDVLVVGAIFILGIVMIFVISVLP